MTPRRLKLDQPTPSLPMEQLPIHLLLMPRLLRLLRLLRLWRSLLVLRLLRSLRRPPQQLQPLEPGRAKVESDSQAKSFSIYLGKLSMQ